MRSRFQGYQYIPFWGNMLGSIQCRSQDLILGGAAAVPGEAKGRRGGLISVNTEHTVFQF